jgi:hypothetical protein
VRTKDAVKIHFVNFDKLQKDGKYYTIDAAINDFVIYWNLHQGIRP